MYLFWAIIGFIFILLDLKKTNIFKLTFANSFMFSAIVAFKKPQEYSIQILSFIAFSVIFYLLIKAILKKEQKDIKKLNSIGDFEDQTAVVTKDIGKTLSIDGLGCINFNNQIWSAKSIDDKEIKAGTKVQIVSKENMILNVKVLEECKK